MTLHNPQAILGWSRVCYGVDLAENSLIIIRAERVGGHLNCTPVQPAAPSFLDDMTRGVPVVACLSAAESFSRWLDAPFPVPGKAARVFPTLLDIQLPFPLEDCVYTFLDPQKTEQRTTQALAVAARRASVELKIAALKEKDLDAQVLDYEGLALWTQSLRESPPGIKEPDAPRAVVYCGDRRSTIVLGRGRRFLCAHSINPADPGHLNRLLHAELAQEDPEASAPTISWFLTGPTAAGGELASHIRKELTRIWPGPITTHEQHDTFLARAVATRALLPLPLSCNLRTGPLTHPQVSQRDNRRQSLAAIIFLLSGLLLFGGNLAADKFVEYKARQLDKVFSSLCVDLGASSTARGEHAIADVGTQMEANRKLLAPFVQAFEPSLGTTMNSIRDAGETQGLLFDELRIEPGQLMVRGTAPDWDACDQLKEHLLKSGHRVTLTRRDALANERIPFTLQSGGSR